MQLQHAQNMQAWKWEHMHDDVHDLFQKAGKRRATSPYSPQQAVTQQLLQNQPAGATALRIAQHNSTTPSSSTDQSNCFPHAVHSQPACMQQKPRATHSRLIACPDQPNSAIKTILYSSNTPLHTSSQAYPTATKTNSIGNRDKNNLQHVLAPG